MSDGETPGEAVVNLTDAKKCWIETSMELERPIPEPTNNSFSGQLRVRMPKSLHRTLSEKAKDENVSLNQYINYQLARSVGHTTNGKTRRRSRPAK
jgi:predicted HicB family RNase H-like nuclease